jgi:hypothetical protein
MHSAKTPIFGSESHRGGLALSLEPAFLFDFLEFLLMRKSDSPPKTNFFFCQSGVGPQPVFPKSGTPGFWPGVR